jgi:hypothetical protein
MATFFAKYMGMLSRMHKKQRRKIRFNDYSPVLNHNEGLLESIQNRLKHRGDVVFIKD